MPLTLHPGHGSDLPLAPLPTADAYYRDYYLPSEDYCIAELRNYAVNQTEYQYEHSLHFSRIVEMIKYVKPIAVWLEGLASHTGNWKYNLELMQRRAVALGVGLNHAGVLTRLFSNSHVTTMSKKDWSHEGDSAPKDPGESGELRGARMLVLAAKEPPPWLPVRMGNIDYSPWYPPGQ